MTIALGIERLRAHQFSTIRVTLNRMLGSEYYKPKLYLLVTKTKDGTKADILTLPDLAKPRYALLHPGYGSSNLSLKLSNGI